MVIVDPGAAKAIECRPIGDRKALNSYRMRWRDVENAKLRCVLRARDSEQVRTRTQHDDTLIDEKRGSGQCYGLSIKRRIEINCVAVINDSQRLTQ